MLMKRLYLLLTLLIGSYSVNAGEYAYLTFETITGAKASVSVSGLAITIFGSTLNAGNRSFMLSNLSKMYFSTSDETSGIENIMVTEWDEAVVVYDLNGRELTKSQLQNGVYVVKTKKGTHKIVVK